MNLYRFDDGEQHWIAATDWESARRWAECHWQIDPTAKAEIVNPEVQIAVCFADKPSREADQVPADPFEDERGNWYVSASAAEWAAAAKDGDLICSTIE